MKGSARARTVRMARWIGGPIVLHLFSVFLCWQRGNTAVLVLPLLVLALACLALFIMSLWHLAVYVGEEGALAALPLLLTLILGAGLLMTKTTPPRRFQEWLFRRELPQYQAVIELVEEGRLTLEPYRGGHEDFVARLPLRFSRLAFTGRIRVDRRGKPLTVWFDRSYFGFGRGSGVAYRSGDDAPPRKVAPVEYVRMKPHWFVFYVQSGPALPRPSRPSG